MPKQSFQYPPGAWPFADLEKHPRFLVLMSEGPMSKLAQLKYAMAEITDPQNAERFGQPEGFRLANLLGSQPARPHTVMTQLVEELCKMRVFEMTRKDGEMWLIPVQVAVGDATEREKADTKIVSAYIPAATYARLRELADRRYQSLSAVVLQAIDGLLAAQA